MKYVRMYVCMYVCMCVCMSPLYLNRNWRRDRNPCPRQAAGSAEVDHGQEVHHGVRKDTLLRLTVHAFPAPKGPRPQINKEYLAQSPHSIGTWPVKELNLAAHRGLYVEDSGRFGGPLHFEVLSEGCVT